MLSYEQKIDFDFTTSVLDTRWMVENLIPQGHLCFVLAQAGVGKSLLLEALGIHVVHELDFAGMKTIAGDVLLIDQDTPKNVLSKRLIRLNNPLGEKKHKLFVHSMEGYTLSEHTLQVLINDYPSVVLVIIDSLHSVLGRLNPNLTTDMNILASFKNQCLNTGKTIIINHHISQKEKLPLDALMTEDAGSLAMGNSAIIQQADSYYIIGASATNGMTDRLYIRPVAKREAIPSKPVILRLMQVENGEKIEYDGTYEKLLDEDIHIDIMTLFREQRTDRTVKETYEAMGHRYGENAVRKALMELDKKNLLILSKAKSNLFKYHLP